MAATAVLVWACAADPANDGNGGGGSCTPTEVTPVCSAPVQCVSAAGACNCDTDAGMFLCPHGEPPGPSDPHGIPAKQPKTGDCCTEQGMICGGWDICAPICRCLDGKWECKDPDCPLFFCPDPIVQLTNQRCDDRPGDTCQENLKGCFMECTCQLSLELGHATWQCSELQCSFDGGVPMDAGDPPPFDAGPFDAGPIDGGSFGEGGVQDGG